MQYAAYAAGAASCHGTTDAQSPAAASPTAQPRKFRPGLAATPHWYILLLVGDSARYSSIHYAIMLGDRLFLTGRGNTVRMGRSQHPICRTQNFPREPPNNTLSRVLYVGQRTLDLLPCPAPTNAIVLNCCAHVFPQTGDFIPHQSPLPCRSACLFQ